jgi:hypothetical protein
LAKKKHKPHRPAGGGEGKSKKSGVGLRQLAGSGAWVLVHPPCARELAEDLEEVREIIAAGEFEVALDELRWLAGTCSDAMEVHQRLGELAVEMGNDLQLARGHFGYAYQLGYRAWVAAGRPAPLPSSQPANVPLHESARGLAWCLEKLGKSSMTDEVVATMMAWDASDPLEVRRLIDDLRTGGLPIVDIE